MWVRNGDITMQSQALHYKNQVLRQCNDLDFFLLQFAASQLGGDAFLSMLIDRFAITDFFTGLELNFRNLIFGDQKKMVSVIQDFLRLIITLLCERSVISGKSSAEKLRTEIIHFLAASKKGLAYSELTKKLHTSLLDDIETERSQSVDEILKTVAKFKYPEGTSGHGVYQLQELYYSEVDPWFCHCILILLTL